MWIMELEKLVLYAKWHVSLYKQAHRPTEVLFSSEMNKASVWVWNYYLLEHPFASPCMHSQYLDFDIWYWNSLFIILNMTILSPHWGMTVSVKAEYTATYIFQSKKILKMASLKMTYFFWGVQIYPVGRPMNASFVNEFIRCFLSPNSFFCIGIHVGSCRGRRRSCYRTGTVLQQWRGSFICFRAMIFWAGANLFKVSKDGNTCTLSARKFSLVSEQFAKSVDFSQEKRKKNTFWINLTKLRSVLL